MFKIKTGIIAEWLCFSVVFFGFLRYFSGTIHIVSNLIVIGTGAILICFCIRNYNSSYKYLFLSIGTIIIGLINIIVVHQNVLGRVFHVAISYFSVALYLSLTKKRISLSRWIIFYLIVSIFLLYRIYLYGNSIFAHHNRNHVSAILYVLLFFVVFGFEQGYKKTPFLLYVIFLICCIAAKGRMGIFCSGFFCILILCLRYYSFDNLKIRRKTLLLTVLAVLIFGFLIFFFSNNINEIIVKLFSRFLTKDNTVINSNIERVAMLKGYFGKATDLKGFFIGINTMIGIPYANKYGGNIHNAYLITHSEYGIVGFLIVLIGTIRGSFVFWKNKYTETSLLLATFYFRSLTDDIWRNDFGTILVWVGILASLNKNLFTISREKSGGVMSTLN